MAKEFDKNNRGAIWKNEKKETKTHPDFTGSLIVEGVEYWVSAWKRDADAPEKAPALSFSIKKKEAKQDAHSEAKSNGYAPKKPSDNFDSDLPF